MIRVHFILLYSINLGDGDARALADGLVDEAQDEVAQDQRAASDEQQAAEDICPAAVLLLHLLHKGLLIDDGCGHLVSFRFE